MKNCIVFILLGSVFFAVSAVNMPTAMPQGGEPQTEFIYKKVGDRELKIYIHYPEGWKDSDKRTAIVFFFGGGWTGGSVNQFHPQAVYFAKRGMVTARADYRVKSRDGVTPDKCVEDAKSAVRWLRKHANTLGIDSDRIITSGGSAGGHLAACTYFTEGLDAINDPADVSAKPNAMVLYNPAVDFLDSGQMMERLGDKRNLARQLSPVRLMHKNMPPTLVLFGTEDFLFDQLKSFADKGKELGAPVRAHIVDGQKHGFFNRTPWLEKTTMWADEFIQSIGYLNPEPKVELPSKNEVWEQGR